MPSPQKAHSGDLRRRRRVFTLAAVLLGLLLAGSVVIGYFTADAWLYWKRHRFPYQGDPLIVPDRRIGFVQRPNLVWRHLLPPVYTVYTDARGARVDRPGMAPPSRVDLLAVGGSFTWGHGVDNPQTFVHRLGRRLDIRVYNVALASYGTTAAYLSIERFADLHPRVVLYGFIRPHLDRSLRACAPSLVPFCRSVAWVDCREGKPYIHPPLPLAPEYLEYVYAVMIKHPFGWRDVYWAIRRHWTRAKRSFAGQTSSCTPEVAMDYLVGKMVSACRRMGAKLLVLYIPFQIPPAAPPEPLLRAVARHQGDGILHFLDLSPAYRDFARRHGAQALWLTPKDHHPSPRAHALIARTAAPVVAGLLAQAGAEKRSGSPGPLCGKSQR